MEKVLGVLRFYQLYFLSVQAASEAPDGNFLTRSSQWWAKKKIKIKSSY